VRRRANVVAAAALLWPVAAAAQALLPPGSDHTTVLTYEGRFSGGEYYPSASEIDVQRRTAAIIEKALAPLTADPLWHVSSRDDFRDHESDALPGAVSRSGLMACISVLEVELDHASQLFQDLQAANERRMQEFSRTVAQAQAELAKGNAAAMQRLQASMPVPVQPTLTVKVETNPRDVSRYLSAENRKLSMDGADYAFVSAPPDPGVVPVTIVGLGGIVKNTIDNGYFIKRTPSRLWRTQHFVEVSIAGDPALASRALAKIDLAELRHILE
jgi:hypothetical protein